MPAVGEMRERVAFEKEVHTPDGHGGQDSVWTEQFRRDAKMIYQRGSEAVQAARLEGRALFKVRIRSSAAARGITTDWRMIVLREKQVSGGEVIAGHYGITEVDSLTDRAWIWLVVEGGRAAQ